MKTVLIYDQCGQEPLKFRVVDGDYSHLEGKYGNCTLTTEKESDEINELVFNKDWYLLEDFTQTFPTQAVVEGAKVVIIGFLP